MDSKVFLQFLPILLLMTVSHLFTGYFTYTFGARLKYGDYTLLFFNHTVGDKKMYILLGVPILQIVYLVGTYLVIWGHVLSLQYFGVMYPSVITNIVMMLGSTIWFMYIKVHEIPNRIQWLMMITLVLLAIAGAVKEFTKLLSLLK